MQVKLVTAGGVPPNIKKFSEITPKDLYTLKDEHGTDWPIQFAVLDDPQTPEFPYRCYQVVDPVMKIRHYKLDSYTRRDPLMKYPPLVQPELNATEVYAIEAKGKLPVKISLEEARRYIDQMSK